MGIRLDHLIYSLIPYKGYGIRAWSNREIIHEVEQAFKGWFSPYEQFIIRPGYELRAITGTLRDNVYLARIFLGEGLDELKRSGVVSHISVIPVKILRDVKIPLEQVDRAMYHYVNSRGIGEGEIDPIVLEIESSVDQLDPDIDYFRRVVNVDQARKILTGISKPNGRVLVIYERDIWSRMRLAYALTKVLLIHGLRNYMILLDKPIDSILIEYENIVLLLSKIIPLRQTGEWTVVKVTGEGGEKRELDIEETLKKIYEMK